MVAWAISVFVQRQRKAAISISSPFGDDVAPLFRRTNAADHQFAILHPADHVHVDHRDCAGERQYRMIHVVVRSDRKSTRLNSSHSQISYAVFCLKKKK